MLQPPGDAPTEGHPDHVGSGGEEGLAVVWVGGGGQGPARVPAKWVRLNNLVHENRLQTGFQ